jgi:hypothetical protein
MSEILARFTRPVMLLRSAADEAMSRHGVRVGSNLEHEARWDTSGASAS